MSKPRRLKYTEHPSLFALNDVVREGLQRIEQTPKEELLKAPCAQGVYRIGQDQYRCGKCGLVWDVDEPRPPCDTTK